MRAAALPSRLISRIVYHDSKRTLRVVFRSGTTYVYHDVPLEAYEALKSAPSPGRHYNREVRGRYRCTFDPARRRFRPDAAA